MPSHICVVIAVHNRIHSVHNALHSWSLQTREDFSVVLADDGSTENIYDLVRMYDGKLRLQYYRQCDVDHGNVAVGLNKGISLAPRETTHVWITDGDIIFNPKAAEAAYRHVDEHPKRVIIGRYDWMPPMEITPEILEADFQKFVNCELPSAGEVKGMQGGAHIDGLKRNVDHRIVRIGDKWFEHQLLDSCKPMLGSNTIIPLEAMYAIGGWDEHIPGSNANDADTGWSLTNAGYKALTCDEITGYHQYHPRNAEALQAGLRKALPYIFVKHGSEIPEKWLPENPEKEIAKIKEIVANWKAGLGWWPTE